MADTPQARAERRRCTWKTGVVHASDDQLDMEIAYWSQISASERMDAVLAMAMESLVLQGHRGPTRRLQGSASGVRRR